MPIGCKQCDCVVRTGFQNISLCSDHHILRNVVDGLQKPSDTEELNGDKDYIDCGRNMFNLKTFKVVENDTKIFRLLIL